MPSGYTWRITTNEVEMYARIADAIRPGNVMTLTIGELALAGDELGIRPVVTIVPIDRRCDEFDARMCCHTRLARGNNSSRMWLGYRREGQSGTSARHAAGDNGATLA